MAYTWKEVHQDLENDKHAGAYGNSHACYHALAELRAKEDLNKYHQRRTKDELLLDNLVFLTQQAKTRAAWDNLITIDPEGMFSKHPTISATTAIMHILELSGLERDGKIVNADGGVNCTKIALDPVWNIPGMAARLQFTEEELRAALYKYTLNPQVKDPAYKVFLPAIGGTTIYLFGDPKKLADLSTEVAVRVHDECNGSDVFGTDICTCRPYLMFAVQGAVECAQRGGVGVVIYFRKEGRALGEVTKFRVYNARKRQEGGDRASTYFAQTESIAGIRDARFQELMPDAILWLGIKRIDKLLSMSSDKYDAIIAAGIEVMERVALPENMVPENAMVEITAKIGAGYHSNGIDLDDGSLARLQTPEAIREKAALMFELAKAEKTKYFSLDMTALPKVGEFVAEVIKKHYPKLDVPYHSRWRHFEAISPKLISDLRATWKCSEREKARRLVDLAFVSVLLDAGAGPTWKYTNQDGNTYTRSEGLAMASYDMFVSGIFSSDPAIKTRVNSLGIKKATLDDFKHILQHSNTNPLVAIEERYNLMQQLANALEANPTFFGYEVSRPGHVVDYVLSHAKDNKVSVRVVWTAIIEGLSAIWPTNAPKVKKGDVWSYTPLKKAGVAGSEMIPFHKISQWLIYSLIEPLEGLGLTVTDLNVLTALAEYRNGGLFIDLGVIKPKNQNAFDLGEFDVGSELIVEWRSLTIALSDLVATEVRKALGKTPEEFPMAKVLQGGTWQAGREIARKLRKDGSPPLNIRLNGVNF